MSWNPFKDEWVPNKLSPAPFLEPKSVSVHLNINGPISTSEYVDPPLSPMLSYDNQFTSTWPSPGIGCWAMLLSFRHPELLPALLASSTPY